MTLKEYIESSKKDNQADIWEKVILIYKSGLREIETKLKILKDEFQLNNSYNPIEHLKSRIKSPDSIVKKLNRLKIESTIENMVGEVHDIAGIRLICSFTKDIYTLAEIISKQNDITVLEVKDYIKNPKASGYRSYHMIVSVPIFLSDEVIDVKVEIQIRTIAMDFWASLEHKIYYKFEGSAPEYISKELREASAVANMLDETMLSLNEAINKCM